jgi:hypothetical protein
MTESCPWMRIRKRYHASTKQLKQEQPKRFFVPATLVEAGDNDCMHLTGNGEWIPERERNRFGALTSVMEHPVKRFFRKRGVL